MGGRDASPASCELPSTPPYRPLPSLLLRGEGRALAAGRRDPEGSACGLASCRLRSTSSTDAGLKLTPSAGRGATIGNARRRAGTGQPKLSARFSLKNAPRVNELAATEIGLEGREDDHEGGSWRASRSKANKPYNAIAQTGVRKTSDAYRQEIRSIGNRTGGESFAGDVPADIVKLKKYYESRPQFSAQDAVNKIRQLRSEGTKNVKAVNAPEQNAKGYVQRAIADALDNELTRHVESLGKPELATEYKSARVQLAKVHTLEDALDGSHVSAKSLAQALDRGAPLSGNMELIARAYKEFDRSFQDFGKIRDSNPFSVLDAGAGVVGASASPPLLAAVLARPAARAVLASDRYQRGLVSGAKKTEAPSPGVSKNSLTRPAVATAPRKEQRK
jgi:hypothetical protein